MSLQRLGINQTLEEQRSGFLRALRPAFCAAAFVAALLHCVRFLRPAVIACAAFCLFSGRVVKEKGEPRGENDHGSFPLLILGQMSAPGALAIRAFRAVSWNECF